GVDYFQTFSPTPKMTTLRVLLHVAAQRDYELHSLDFNTAFLQGSLHEEIWLCRPPGFTGSFPPGTQWSLRRPVYGLRQAPREWHDTWRTTHAALGFSPSTADPSLFLRTDTLLPPFYILVYVDSLVFATADTAGLAHVKSELQKRHTCTDLGELRSYLGLQITRERARRTITLTQSHMVQQVLQRFDFTYSSPQATPLSTRHSLSALPSDESVEPSGPYPELVGCLMYLMTCTQPDLAYPLSILARYVAPGRHRPEHMAAAKRVLRCLCSTSGLGLVLGGRSPVVLTGHADASWVYDLATQRSSQGYTFSLGSGSVLWRSTRSSSVLSSSCEAEIYAGAMAAQELRWLTYLLTDLGEAPLSPPLLYVDNKAMLALCREHRLEHRTKHIALRYFLARELQQRGQLRLAYVASQANTADIFTKALQPCDHQRFCTMLGLAPREWHGTLRSTLADLGFIPSSADPSMFVRSSSTYFFVLVYIDDLVFATADRVVLAFMKSELQKSRTCTDICELRRYLGLQITTDRAARTITLTQSHMVQHVLWQFELRFSTTQPTSLAVDHKLTSPLPGELFESNGPYAELVGCLMYLMTCTRPDLAFLISVMACFLATGRHRHVHLAAAMRIAKYLETTSGMGLAEIYAGAMATQELRWLTFLLIDLGERPCSAPTLFSDNKATILMYRESRLEGRVKHINMRYFLLRELQRRGQGRLDLVASAANTADIFTKALPPSDHHRFCVQLGLV
ncbi:unnamed protein product, partial [Closterium sp. NIES-53]